MKKDKLIIYLLFIILIMVIFILNKNDIKRADVNIDNIQRIVETFGIVGILIYIVLNGIRPFFLVPTTVFFIGGGVIFGFIEGFIYTSVGVIIASSLSFKVSKIFQKEFRKILEILKLTKYVDKIHDLDENKIIRGLLYMRITPIFPFDPISFGAGMANIDYKDFIIGTTLGILPKILFYTFIGSYLENII
ncbi:VTT domain-containing protein [Clostridium sp. D2Q-11]|uniref:TVP38/TMEM64 family membrane protein n=1 Tax=Anaeromonas frigoriresistens TaxID=2683708 RepID=A0A942Z5T5_9FIRM|nr:VTT domain-containing protein [Anaeromonas frigoriresistens]MBS4536827.1 VTT domain-containing protein [Anaeromonas frigoriresistens]